MGYLEEPSAIAGPGMGVQIAGWVFCRGDEIARLYLRDGSREVGLSRDLLRPDVEARFPDEPRAVGCGFHGTLPIDHAAPALEIHAELAGGSRRLVFAASLGRSSLWSSVRARLSGAGARRAFAELLQRAAAERFPRVAEAAHGIAHQLHRSPAFEWLAVARPASAGPRRRSGTHRNGAGSADLLIVSAMFPSTAHAGGLRLFDLIRELSPRHAIDLIAPFREAVDAPAFEALRPHLRAVERLRSTELHPREVVEWLSRLGRKSGDYRAVHFEFPGSAATIDAVLPFAQKSVYTMMECLTLSSLIDLDNALAQSGDVAAAAARFLRSFAVEREALARVDVAVAVTNADAELAQRCFGVRPEVLPTCVSEHEIFARLDPARDQPEPGTVLFIGYFDHYANQDAVVWYLKEVHPIVAARVPQYRFRVVGRGDLSAIRARWGGDSRVEIVGAVDDLARELQRARVGAAPMVSGAGIRGKINQLAAAGRPTVATPLGALGLPYRHDESIAIAARPDEFAHATIRLLTDDSHWQKLRGECRALVDRHFRWPQVAAKLERLHGS